MPVDLIVFLILAYDFGLLSFSSWDVPKMCQGTHSLTNSLIHSNGRSDKTGDSSVIRHGTWNHTEKTTYGLDSACKLGSPKFITSLKKASNPAP